VNELGLGTSKFESISFFFLDFGQGNARPRPGYRVMLKPIYFSFVHLSQTNETVGPWCK
jgi:hypothetical protein